MAQPNIFELLDQLSKTSCTREKVGQDITIAAILHLLEKQPDAAKQKDNRDCTPLQEAFGNFAPLEIVDALLTSWPDAVKENDSGFGYTPLHMACMENVQLEVVSALLQVWPDAARQKDRFGSMPLHHA
eukprot:15236365-Ditylum_brightwellii.AAC.1